MVEQCCILLLLLNRYIDCMEEVDESQSSKGQYYKSKKIQR